MNENKKNEIRRQIKGLEWELQHTHSCNRSGKQRIEEKIFKLRTELAMLS